MEYETICQFTSRDDVVGNWDHYDADYCSDDNVDAI